MERGVAFSADEREKVLSGRFSALTTLPICRWGDRGWWQGRWFFDVGVCLSFCVLSIPPSCFRCVFSDSTAFRDVMAGSLASWCCAGEWFRSLSDDFLASYTDFGCC